MSAPHTDGLVDLPGSSRDPGAGPVVVELVENLLDDAAPAAVASDADVPGTLAAHRDHRVAWYGDLAGPLVVPADRAPALQEALTSTDYGLRVLLAAPSGPHEAARQVLRGARDLLAEDERVEVVGVVLRTPDGPAAQAMARLLDTLDFSAPAWVTLHPGTDAPAALDVLAQDGAEHLGLAVDGASGADLALTLRTAIDLDLTFRAVGADLPVVAVQGPSGDLRHGILNLLCAVRAALNGAEAEQVEAILAATEPAVLTSALRRMSEADAAVARAFLAGVEVHDLDATAQALAGLGLVDPALLRV